MTKKIIRLPEVLEKTGLSRSTVYSAISEGTFPRQIHMGRRCTGWLSSEIDEWIDHQVEISRDEKTIIE
ncbi:AlpA family transcriptional regulator [Aestuariicella hydrocarbonica]|uniref:AlpA family transcriptional regulator n=1 Tax=Pseudomaricurvus hydrocarbonicus TaxID=1470433 RepID=A0A9E5MQ30_9GAMM|nr:AlpA family transcriptional regulator [Aestuariicella hydrocarbonica]NHO68413.1 AlpA family transcriptional regulator [Aestuariicella hydrocarbonica]